MNRDDRNGFKGHDRHCFPEPVRMVTGGFGGDALLIMGPEKTALYDAGMPCFSDRMIANIKRELSLSGRTLDYVVLSHTHYDHMGGLPYVLKQWPHVTVCASAKAARVFASQGAKKTIQRMGENAARQYGVDNMEIIVDPLRVDWIVKDGDRISLGTDGDGRESYLEVYETRGHTDCSLSYMVMPQKILLCCESCGVLISPDVIEVSALKSFEETIRVAERLKHIDFEYLYSQHYGMVPDWFKKEYFDLYIRLAEEEMKFLEDQVKRGIPEDEILKAHRQKYWDDSRNQEQPFEAYKINTESEIKQIYSKIFSENNENVTVL